MRFGPVETSIATLVVALIAACGGDPSGPVGEFDVLVDGDGFGLTMSHPSGFEMRTAPTAAGFRTGRATYEMQFGSFLIEDPPLEDWREGVRLTSARRDGDTIEADIIGDRGEALGRLIVSPSSAGLSLRVEAEGEDVNRAFIALECDDPSRGGFLGFGAQTHDVDHRGQIVPVWVSEQGIGKVETDEPADVWFLAGTRHQSYLSVPTMMAPRAGASFGLHSTTFHRSIWDLCATDPEVLRVEVWDGAAELILSPGPGPLEVVEQQTSLTGRIPEPPDWTFGVWMEAVGGSDAVRAEADLLREHAIPASAIWSEDWRGAVDNGRSYVLEEDWRWDRDLYPGLPDLASDLRARGMAFMTYFNTFVVEGVDVYDEALDGGHLVLDRRGEPFGFQAPDFETSYLADLFAPASREFVKDELKAALDLGIDGWMADFAEWYPADPRTVSTSDGRDPEAAHHQYPLEWAVVNREAVDEHGADDVVIFHRSGYTGSQGQAHVVWAGDQRTSFQADDGLPTIVPILLGLSVTGFPVVTHDIAGYVSATNPPSTRELFFRWTSLGAMAPVMRTHHGRDAALNWRWSGDAGTIAHFKRWADLHTRLFPMWAGLARDAARAGAPILRPMAFADPGDVRLHAVKDAYMIGDALLVAPVLTASVSVRQVELPRGDWFDWWTHEVHAGGGTISLAVPQGDLGLLARAGAVVPLLVEGVESLRANEAVQDLEEVRAIREVRVWLGANGEATDASGGRFSVTSGARPAGAVTVEGAKEVQVDAAAHLRLTAAPNSAVLLSSSEGTHVVASEGLPAETQVTFDVRW